MVLWIVATVLLSPLALWILYLANTSLQRAHDEEKMSPWGYLGALIVYYLFIAVDTLVNLTLFSLLVLDLPRERLVTDHMIRILSNPTEKRWRRQICEFICKHFLDAFDPSGCHCRWNEEKNER